MALCPAPRENSNQAHHRHQDIVFNPSPSFPAPIRSGEHAVPTSVFIEASTNTCDTRPMPRCVKMLRPSHDAIPVRIHINFCISAHGANAAAARAHRRSPGRDAAAHIVVLPSRENDVPLPSSLARENNAPTNKETFTAIQAKERDTRGLLRVLQRLQIVHSARRTPLRMRPAQQQAACSGSTAPFSNSSPLFKYFHSSNFHRANRADDSHSPATSPRRL
jgi:hypothetical protein